MAEDAASWYRSTKGWQQIAAGGVLLLIFALALCRRWPFHQEPPDLGENPSIFEILLNDRVTLGLLRAGLAAIVVYAVVSIPALVVAGRWMKGLTTTGVTVDDAERADTGIEDLQSDLRGAEDIIQDQVTQIDLLSQLALEQDAELQHLRSREEPGEGGDED